MMSTTTTPPVRIACLEPSATAICLELGLGDCLVGVTHECGPVLDAFRKQYGKHDDDRTLPQPLVLTKSGLVVHSQAEIHRAVQETSTAAVQALQQQQTCRKPKSTTPPADEVDAHIAIIVPQPEEIIATADIPTLYPLLPEQMAAAQPTIIFTQDLCQVCAPTTSDVRRCLLQLDDGQAGGGDDCNSSNSNNNHSKTPVSVVALQPTNLLEVVETFATIATACGIPERGEALKAEFLTNLHDLQKAVESNRDSTQPMPRLFILEWLDPPFDSGHWTYQMMEYACVQTARPDKSTHKAIAIDWEDVSAADPDLVVVGCCGFDLERNIQDTLTQAKQLQKLRAGRNGRIFASNGDRYIAQPAPSLLQGVALLAQCAYQGEPKVLQAIHDLGYESIGWEVVDVNKINNSSDTNGNVETNQSKPLDSCIGDLEDIGANEGHGWAQLHKAACDKGEMTYEDPETGYSVFTALAHKKRGKCCGSGCRHCPYSHENVKDKASRIQQPAVLFRPPASATSCFSSSSLFSIDSNEDIKVLFFSGGKDSFLTIRSLVRQHETKPFGLVLLTTFDVTTRVIAHQEVNVDQVVRQASHLGITLVGVPLRRGSGETYVDRARAGLDVIQSIIPPTSKLSALVFGDLHLTHVKEWRDSVLTKLDCDLEYPLWKTPYPVLLDDLEASKVPCQISGSTREEIDVGTFFDRVLYDSLAQTDMDQFGESGEFHSLARVWEVSRSIALGLDEKE